MSNYKSEPEMCLELFGTKQVLIGAMVTMIIIINHSCDKHAKGGLGSTKWEVLTTPGWLVTKNLTWSTGFYAKDLMGEYQSTTGKKHREG